LRMQLKLARASTLQLLEDMRDAPLVFPTPRGGCHPLWILGNLALSEALFLHEWILGEANPLARWDAVFGPGVEPVADASVYPTFDEVMVEVDAVRARVMEALEACTEADLDAPSFAPSEMAKFFGTRRQVFLTMANHWLVHRGQVADARRAAGRERIGI